MAIIYELIIQYIDANIRNDITLKEIAEKVGYSPNHIYKMFKQYSPQPIMEYIRRKKLYAAASEMYAGGKLYDIALDYGYETPAGFYKAFKSVFGCSPKEYKNNIKKVEINMHIKQVETLQELTRGIAFFNNNCPTYPTTQGEPDNDEKFGKKWWTKKFESHPQLLLFAKEDDEIRAVTFGFIDHGSVTIHEGVQAEYKNTGIREALFVEMERRVKAVGIPVIALGINEGEEAFYANMGYVGKTLIQSEKYTVDELLSLNKQHNNYEVIGTNVYEGYMNQLWLQTSLLDTNLKKKFEQEIEDCWVQVIVVKNLCLPL